MTKVNPRIAFTIILWLMFAWLLARPLQGLGENIYSVFGSFTNSMFKNLYETKSSAEELIKSQVLLKEQSKTISLLQIKLNSLGNQIKEVENLKDLLNLKKHISYRTLSTKVIGRSADNWHKQIILDKGENFQIMQGDSVLSKNGIVGQIVEINKNTSVVQLISDPSYKLGCKIYKKNIIGILSGITNLVGLLEFIPVGTNITLGDIVVTSGIKASNLSPTYPAGHPIGQINKISKKKRKASDLYIEVKLFEDLTSLNDVLVFSPD